MIRAGLIALSIACVAAATPQNQPASRPRGSPDAFRGEDGLVRAYQLILDARFDDLDTALRRACGPAPIEACQVLDATALWWRIQLDPDSRGRRVLGRCGSRHRVDRSLGGARP